MALSLAIILLGGLGAKWIFEKIKLPGLLGMLILGILIGPYCLNLIGGDMQAISDDIRLIALLIILLRAGLGIKREELKKVGATAVKLSCIPGILEGFTIAGIAMVLLGFSFVEGGILGFIVAAVSPAVVVPLMLHYNEQKIGTNKSIPTLILAGASVDDVFAITLFYTFMGLYTGSKVNIGFKLLGIPVAIILGLLIGAIIGIIFVKLFNKYSIRDSKKVFIILSTAILLISFQDYLKNRFSFEIAGLLGVMAIGFFILEQKPTLAKRLSLKFNKIWLMAEILLFVLVGAKVNIYVAADAGAVGLVIIAVGLVARSIGVAISTWGSHLNMKERFFAMIAYTPKATVQAAIGAVPLTMGVASGEIILAIAVLSILVTAPLGSIGIKLSAKRWLEQE